MKSSLPADRHEENFTRKDNFQTPACRQAGARFPRKNIGAGYVTLKKTIINT
ncbi:MAG: hypothetical protein WDZ72_12540 [Cyclobacteriaceae bacterium]